jgi:hypothetical protein
MIAFLVTLTATGVNLYAVVKLFSNGVTPLLSMLAVGFGVYIAMFQWNSLRTLNMYFPRART